MGYKATGQNYEQPPNLLIIIWLLISFQNTVKNTPSSSQGLMLKYTASCTQMMGWISPQFTPANSSSKKFSVIRLPQLQKLMRELQEAPDSERFLVHYGGNMNSAKGNKIHFN